jgi:hydrogenase maturation protease
MEAWQGADVAVIIDAAVAGAPAGTVHRVAAHRETLPPSLKLQSSHQFGVVEAIEMARVLGRLPRVLIVYAIEAASFAYGTTLSPAVARAVEEVVRGVREDLAAGPFEDDNNIRLE